MHARVDTVDLLLRMIITWNQTHEQTKHTKEKSIRHQRTQHGSKLGRKKMELGMQR